VTEEAEEMEEEEEEEEEEEDLMLEEDDEDDQEEHEDALQQPHFEQGQRQTLLFSATALRKEDDTHQSKKNKKKMKKVTGLVGNIESLPDHLKQLLSVVAVQKSIEVVDVTAMQSQKASSKSSSSGTSTTPKAAAEEPLSALPKTLSQFQINVPTEEKDTMAYYYLLKNPTQRTLLFVNSIKTARRVDGLLRALGVNCRTIHAQLQQRQRLRSLEAFRSSPVGVLVATDVAARGLDIPKIQSVIHYDIARSPQLYIHRSGRTARANASGTSISLVAPEDNLHHGHICTALGIQGENPKMTLLPIDSATVPLLTERIKLAKKIFTQSFVASQKTKESSWLQQNASQADLELDDYMVEEEGTREEQQSASKMSKKALDKAKAELQRLLDTPIEIAKTAISSRKRGFVVFAK